MPELVATTPSSPFGVCVTLDILPRKSSGISLPAHGGMNAESATFCYIPKLLTFQPLPFVRESYTRAFVPRSRTAVRGSAFLHRSIHETRLFSKLFPLLPRLEHAFICGRRHVVVQRFSEEQGQGQIRLRTNPGMARPRSPFLGPVQQRRLGFVCFRKWPHLHQPPCGRGLRPAALHQRPRLHQGGLLCKNPGRRS